MDIAITLSSSLGEIISYEPEKTKAQLYQSGLKVGSDVVGPMVNIMFFSYLSGSIPMTLIFLRNDMSFNFIFPVSLSLEVTRALVGSIGIVLSIPITSHLASYFFTKEVSYER